MLIHIKNFNGVLINDGTNYRSALINPRSQPDANLVFIEQAKAPSEYAGMFTLGVSSIPITLRVEGQTNRDALIAALKESLQPGTEGNLVVTFSDEARDYQKRCVVQSLTPVEGHRDNFILILQSGETTWRTVSVETDSWAVTASGDTKTIDVNGYSESRLSLTVTPTSLPGTGWAYQQLYQLPNKVGITAGNRPWCITLDTATLVSGGKCQADCDDLLAVVDGIIVHRWIANPNNAATKIWINLNMLAGRQLTLLTPVASSGAITELAFQVNANNKAALTALPSRGYLQHGTEWFEYTGKTITTKILKVTGVTRAALSTTMQAHSAADTFEWIQHVIYILYGNSAATNPSTSDSAYDNDKPIFDLSTSTNSSWAYTATTGFYDPLHSARLGGWKPTITRTGPDSDNYPITGDSESGNPAMGMRMKTWVKNAKAQAEKATITWLFNSGGVGISTVSTTGRKYRSGAQWPATEAAKLERSLDQKTWYKVWFEATPSAVTTWESFTRATAAITANNPSVRVSLAGSLPAALDVSTYFEVLTASVDFVSGNLPTGTLLGEKSNYLLRVSILNQTNGDEIGFQFPMLINKVLDVDGEAFQITYDSVSANSALILDDNSREIWMRLVPGDNDLMITGEDVGSLTVGLSWLERRR